MHRPALVTAPAELPVSLEEMKHALRILERDGAGVMLPHEDDELITTLIRSAVAHYEGWTGVLGIVLATQTWRQDFDWFARELRLPLGPVRSITSVKWRNAAGQIATIDSAEYALVTDAGGQSSARFRDAYTFPTGLYEHSAVQVEYVAGWPTDDAGKSTLPNDIKLAIKLRVQLAYDEVAQASSEYLARAENELIGKWRRWSI